MSKLRPARMRHFSTLVHACSQFFCFLLNPCAKTSCHFEEMIMFYIFLIWFLFIVFNIILLIKCFCWMCFFRCGSLKKTNFLNALLRSKTLPTPALKCPGMVKHKVGNPCTAGVPRASGMFHWGSAPRETLKTTGLGKQIWRKTMLFLFYSFFQT